LHGSQGHPQSTSRVLLAIAPEEAAFDHVRQSRHFGSESLEGFMQHHETFVCIDAEGFRVRKCDVRVATSTFVSQPGGCVVDERMPHGQGSGSQKVRFIGVTAGLAQPQIRFMNQRGGLQRVGAMCFSCS
jgi:hypothetical protein